MSLTSENLNFTSKTQAVINWPLYVILLYVSPNVALSWFL